MNPSVRPQLLGSWLPKARPLLRCGQGLGGWAQPCVTQWTGNSKQGLSPSGIHWGGEGKATQSGGRLKVRWLSSWWEERPPHGTSHVFPTSPRPSNQQILSWFI